MQKTFLYRSATIAYTINGKGKCIVLVHGFGETGKVWDEQLAFLSETFLLIIPDLPGSGGSTLLAGENISIDDYADVIVALLATENIETCTVLGHSMGGYITLSIAARYPQMLEGFGWVNSTAFADTEEKKRTREKGIAFIREHGAHAFLKTSIPGLFGERFKQEYPEKVSALIEAAKEFPNESLIQYYRAMIARPDQSEILKSNPIAVLFVIGTEDIAAPLSDVLKQTKLPDKSYIHILPGVGHMGMWEAADAVNRFISAFVNR